MKIGSIVPGVIRKMYVEENDYVKKGQLLAEIDDGKEDTDVRSTRAELEKSKAALAYQQEFYSRQKALYEKDHISKDAFQKFAQDYLVAQDDVRSKQALHDQAILVFTNKKILAPNDGLVISKVARVGETVTLSSPPTLIYTIAHNIKKLKARPNLDESAIGKLKSGIKATMTFDTYPYKTFEGTLTDISNSSVNTNGAVSYLGTILISNDELLLRPGMSVNVDLFVTEKEDVLSLPGYIFKLNPTALREIAQIKKYTFKELSVSEKNKIKGNIKSVWLFENNNTFVERAVTVGLSDNAFFEVISGLNDGDLIIIDTAEPDAMEQYYKRMFGKGL